MSGRSPDDIWQDALDEGERRLRRSPLGLVGTGFAGGGDVALGILAMAVLQGALTEPLGEDLAHVLGSFVFGLGFVFITLGRAELFTENFLIPVGSVLARRGRTAALLRMWGITFVLNLAALAALAYLVVPDGVLKEPTLKAFGSMADVYAERHFGAALCSAVIGGIVMTVFTWIAVAAENDTTRLLAALGIGFLLAAPSLNHAVVSSGELLFGLATGTAKAGWLDLVQNLGVATLGNLLGGIGMVTLTRLWQVSGEGG